VLRSREHLRALHPRQRGLTTAAGLLSLGLGLVWGAPRVMHLAQGEPAPVSVSLR